MTMGIIAWLAAVGVLLRGYPLISCLARPSSHVVNIDHKVAGTSQGA